MTAARTCPRPSAAAGASGRSSPGDYPDAVATFSAVTRQHILRALAEYDDRGREAFLGVYGFSTSHPDDLVHEGRSYEPTAVLGVAHKYATGRLASADELAGERSPVSILRKHGFEIAGPAPALPAPRRARPAAAPAAPRRVAVPERVAAICPTCSMTLPATGVCDDCG